MKAQHYGSQLNHQALNEISWDFKTQKKDDAPGAKLDHPLDEVSECDYPFIPDLSTKLYTKDNIDFWLYQNNGKKSLKELKESLNMKSRSKVYYNSFKNEPWKETITLKSVHDNLSNESLLPEARCITSTSNNQIIAFISGFPKCHEELKNKYGAALDTFFIAHLCVIASYRKVGLAEILMNELLKSTCHRYPVITARIDKSVTASQKICKKFDFYPTQTFSLQYPSRQYWMKSNLSFQKHIFQPAGAYYNTY